MKLLLPIFMILSSSIYAGGNETSQSFSKAKKNLERKVYFDHRKTIYCAATFDEKKSIKAPIGFTAVKYKKRAKRVEWEHVVPAENFGRSFAEWRNGNSQCVSKKGKSFKGGRCAEKMNVEYRYMQSDMHRNTLYTKEWRNTFLA